MSNKTEREMDNQPEFIATFTTSVQITESEWIKKNPSMKVTPETTIAEIQAFYKKWNNGGVMEVKIIELV